MERILGAAMIPVPQMGALLETVLQRILDAQADWPSIAALHTGGVLDTALDAELPVWLSELSELPERALELASVLDVVMSLGPLGALPEWTQIFVQLRGTTSLQRHLSLHLVRLHSAANAKNKSMQSAHSPLSVTFMSFLYCSSVSFKRS